MAGISCDICLHNVQDFYQAHEMMISPESNGKLKRHPKGDASLVNNLGSKAYISFVYDQSSIPAYSLAFSKALSNCFSYLAGTSKLLSFSILKICA